MNLSKLFDMQRALDEKIIREKGLEGQDLLPMKILALQVELGECANEWRGFKFWSKNQQPRTKENYLSDPNDVWSPLKTKNPLLEEYVDCLHFILSIGLDLKFQNFKYESVVKAPNITQQFNALINKVGVLWLAIMDYATSTYTVRQYAILFGMFVNVGEKLGFTWEQIEQAYIRKNEVNHERQANGY